MVNKNTFLLIGQQVNSAICFVVGFHERTLRMDPFCAEETICNSSVARRGIDATVQNEKIVSLTGMQERLFNMLRIKAQEIPQLAH